MMPAARRGQPTAAATTTGFDAASGKYFCAGSPAPAGGIRAACRAGVVVVMAFMAWAFLLVALMR